MPSKSKRGTKHRKPKPAPRIPAHARGALFAALRAERTSHPLFVALQAGFDGPPRTSIANTTSTTDYRFLDFLSRMAPQFDSLIKLENPRLHETTTVGQNESFRRAMAGDVDAMLDVFLNAAHAAELLNELGRRQAESVRAMAKHCPFWVFAVSPKGDLYANVQDELRRLDVGQRCSVNVAPNAGWKTANSATAYVQQIYGSIIRDVVFLRACKAHGVLGPDSTRPPLRENLLRLPPLSKATADRWFNEVIWVIVMEETQGHPEQVERLKELGLVRSAHYETKDGKLAGALRPTDEELRKRVMTKTQASDCRDGIKTRLRQAFKSMAANPPAAPMV